MQVFGISENVAQKPRTLLLAHVGFVILEHLDRPADACNGGLLR